MLWSGAQKTQAEKRRAKRSKKYTRLDAGRERAAAAADVHNIIIMILLSRRVFFLFCFLLQILFDFATRVGDLSMLFRLDQLPWSRSQSGLEAFIKFVNF